MISSSIDIERNKVEKGNLIVQRQKVSHIINNLTVFLFIGCSDQSSNDVVDHFTIHQLRLKEDVL